jgi:molybdopterin-guanine dinucleotide biosynthesis protein A
VGDATNVRAAVLAGGAASRFGGAPKGLERVGGERILDRVAAAAYTAVGAPPLLIANAADAQSWRPDLTVVPDARHGCGSIGGIYTAVTAGEGPVLVVAWDMPFVPEDLLIALVQGAAGCDVFLPESRAIGFHEDVRVGTLPLDLVTRFGDPEHLFFNVNTAEDLVRAEEMWRQRA